MANNNKLTNGLNYAGSFLGAVGTGIQNYMGSVQFIQYFMGQAYSLSDAGVGIAHSCAAALGGASSIFVNYLLNVELIRDFIFRLKRLRLRSLQRHYDEQVARLEELKQNQLRAQADIERIEAYLAGRKLIIDRLQAELGAENVIGLKSGLTGWKKVMCWIGIGLFIVSGLLYGLMAVAVAPQGVLAILGIIAGALVTPIQTIQEIEVWVGWLDPMRASEASRSSKLAKGVGIGFSIATVVVLSTLFTLGIASFLMSFGVAALPAVIAGAAVAFSVGAFTEFFFYAPYLMSFCGDVSKTIQEFKASKKPLLGLLIVGLNAAANGVMAGFAIGLLIGVIVAAGAAVPPFGGVLAVAILGGVIAAAASFMLGTKFWISKFGADKPKSVEGSEVEPLVEDGSTHAIVAEKTSRRAPVVSSYNEEAKDTAPISASLARSPRGAGLFGLSANNTGQTAKVVAAEQQVSYGMKF